MYASGDTKRVITLGATVGPDTAYDDGTTLPERFEAWAADQGKVPRVLGEFLDPNHDMTDGVLRTYSNVDFLATCAGLDVLPYVHFNVQLQDGDTYADMMLGAPTQSGLPVKEHLWRIGKIIGTRSVRMRFMHEFNAGSKQWWDALGPDQFVKTWRMFARQIKAVAPAVQLNWCIASGGQDDWDKYWPGAEYVDSIGVDCFPAIDTQFTQRKYANMEAIYRFAAQERKALQMPMMGLGGGADDAAIAERLCKWIVAHADRLRYVGVGETRFPNSDTRIGDTHPNMLAVWREFVTRPGLFREGRWQ